MIIASLSFACENSVPSAEVEDDLIEAALATPFIEINFSLEKDYVYKGESFSPSFKIRYIGRATNNELNSYSYQIKFTPNNVEQSHLVVPQTPFTFEGEQNISLSSIKTSEEGIYIIFVSAYDDATNQRTTIKKGIDVMPPLPNGYKLNYQDNFNATKINEADWYINLEGTNKANSTAQISKRARDKYYYKATLKSKKLVHVENGFVRLRGIVNPQRAQKDSGNNIDNADKCTFLIGGLWSSPSRGKDYIVKYTGSSEPDYKVYDDCKNKRSFQGYGIIQIKARYGQGGAGSWPALWMQPYDYEPCNRDEQGWPPIYGEIDFCERYGDRNIFEPTVHRKNQNFATRTKGVVLNNKYDYHIFATKITEKDIYLSIDDDTFSNSSLGWSNTNVEQSIEKFPWNKPWGMRFDMQIGGDYPNVIAGIPTPSNIAPSGYVLDIDWVRHLVPEDTVDVTGFELQTNKPNNEVKVGQSIKVSASSYLPANATKALTKDTQLAWSVFSEDGTTEYIGRQNDENVVITLTGDITPQRAGKFKVVGTYINLQNQKIEREIIINAIN